MVPQSFQMSCTDFLSFELQLTATEVAKTQHRTLTSSVLYHAMNADAFPFQPSVKMGRRMCSCAVGERNGTLFGNAHFLAF